MSENVITREVRYEIAKAAPTGTNLECPHCGTPFTKASYQQAFCSNKGSGNCKDAYWNSRGARQRQSRGLEDPGDNATEAELREMIGQARPFVADGIKAMQEAMVSEHLTAVQASELKSGLDLSYALLERMNRVHP